LVFSDKLAYAVAHLGCGLVGERQRQDPPWATPAETKLAIRWVSTRVLPDLGPVTTSSGPSVCATASACCSLSPSS